MNGRIWTVCESGWALGPQRGRFAESRGWQVRQHRGRQQCCNTDIGGDLSLRFTACMRRDSTATLIGQSLGGVARTKLVGGAGPRAIGHRAFCVVGLCRERCSPFHHRIRFEFSGRASCRRVSAAHHGLATPVIAIAMILSEGLFGGRETKFVALAQFLRIFGWLVPAYIVGLAMHLSLNGVWIVAFVYVCLAAVDNECQVCSWALDEHSALERANRRHAVLLRRTVSRVLAFVLGRRGFPQKDDRRLKLLIACESLVYAMPLALLGNPPRPRAPRIVGAHSALAPNSLAHRGGGDRRRQSCGRSALRGSGAGGCRSSHRASDGGSIRSPGH